ncbi:MAG: 5-oxoprolinase subunit PxpB [Lachnospiraceae bacterium]
MSIKFSAAGERAVTVQFGDTISLEINKQVMMLHNELNQNRHSGIVETVPSYSSLMIHYRSEEISFADIKALLTECLGRMKEAARALSMITEIPVLYGGQLGMDLEDCARMENITVDELIRIHCSHDYYVYMLGFAPGHPYTARFEEPYHFKRRESPRVKVSGGSVVAAENLSNILPFDQPCGWNIIGHTPLKLCDYNSEFPFLLKAGQWIRFVPVMEKEYDTIVKQVERGEYQVKSYEKAVV